MFTPRPFIPSPVGGEKPKENCDTVYFCAFCVKIKTSNLNCLIYL